VNSLTLDWFEVDEDMISEALEHDQELFAFSALSFVAIEGGDPRYLRFILTHVRPALAPLVLKLLL
jgi:hypothetical protein